MLKTRIKFLGCLMTAVLLICLGVYACSVYSQYMGQRRQEQLNSTLLLAIQHNDTKQALHSLERGANPNVNEVPAEQHSFWQYILDRLRGRRITKRKCLPPLLMMQQ